MSLPRAIPLSTKPSAFSSSLLVSSVGTRLVIAFAVCGLLWLAVFWALA